MSMQDFFDSLTGQIITLLVLLVMFGGVLVSGKGRKNTTTTMVVSALLVALSIALNQITLFQMPQGGSVSVLGMLPIVVCAYLFGTRRAVMCGMCVGLLDLILKPYVVHPVQLLLDYPFAFGAIGFAGIIFMLKKEAFIPAYLVGAFGRLVMAVLSGVIFFGAYAPEGMNPFVYSLGYNFSYIAAEAAITCIVIAIPAVRKALIRIKRELDIQSQLVKVKTDETTFESK